MAEYRQRILVDFDGVLHSYESGWQGARTIADPPVPGAISWLCHTVSQIDVAILSSRSHQFGGRWAMKRWLRKHAAKHFYETHDGLMGMWKAIGFRPGMDPVQDECRHAANQLVKLIQWPKYKVPSLLTIDDRAICFDGAFPRVAAIKEFKPWNRV